MDSMPPSHLADFLRRPDVIDNNPELCLIYSNYMKTQMFLETVRLERCADQSSPYVWVPNSSPLHRRPSQQR